MDTRRLLIIAAVGLGLSGCAVFRADGPTPPLRTAPAPALADGFDPQPGLVDPAPAAPMPVDAPSGRPYEADAAPVLEPEPEPRTVDAGPQDARVGGVQVFAWSPGRVYPVRAAPLRVTTLTLGAGETLVSKAAGDTVRWQIGETTSGEGMERRAHVLIKPLQRGLDTNLVLTTNRRVYLIDLTSVGVDGFNVAVAWDAAALEPVRPVDPAPFGRVRVPDPVVTPQGDLDARYRIEPQGRRPRWTPTSVFNDGLRTFVAFDPDLQIDEAPALFVIAPDGEAQLVNYRQSGGLFIVDRVFDRAELRLGDRRPQVVRIHRLQGAAR